MDVFLKLFNMSITASWLVLVVILLRLILKKAPKALHCVLWAMVAIRLICPFSIQSMFSLIPTTQTIPQEVLYVEPSSTSAITNSVEIELLTNPVYPESVRDTVTVMTGGLQIDILFAYLIWLGGMAAMLTYTLISYLRLRVKVREAVRLRDNIWLCDHVSTPFILGILRPRIFLPSAMNEEEMQYVIAHEQAHLGRRDHFWKPLGFLLLTVYWFNPVLWIAYILLCRDIESACDEKVLRAMGEESKKPYADALIGCAAPRRIISACPLAFGETGVKSRVKSVLNYKKPAFWLILVAIMACAAVAVYFLTDPMGVRLLDKNETEMPDFITCMADGETYKYSSESSISYIIDLLHDVRVSAEPISEDRSEDRDKTNTVTFSYTGRSDVQYHFNADCDEVWISDGVKPTLSQRVYDAGPLQQFFANQIEGPAAATGSTPVTPGRYTQYTYEHTAANTVTPIIWLSESDSTFRLSNSYPKITDYNMTGSYTLTDTTLTLRSGDGKRTFVFAAQLNGDRYTFAFDASKSDGLLMFEMKRGANESWIVPAQPTGYVPDGAEFCFRVTGDVHTASFDIDDDGQIETVLMDIGPTSGVLTHEFTVLNGDKVEHHDITESDSYFLSFVQKNGKIYACGENEGVEPPVRLYEVSIEEGRIKLTKTDLTYEVLGTAVRPQETVCKRYEFPGSEDPLTPTILLSRNDNTFQFTYSALSSYLPSGTYELTDDQLVLLTSDQWTEGQYISYTFDVHKDEMGAYVFTYDAAASSPIPTYNAAIGEAYCPVPDGAVFIYTGEQTGTASQPGRAASFDIDKDGIVEQCVLSDTPYPDSSEAFLKVYSLGKLQLVGQITVDAYDLKFAQEGEDTYIVAKRRTGEHETVRMEITVDGEFATLYENGVQVGGIYGVSCY